MQISHLHQSRKSISKYDYIFCGIGASASLLILELSRNGLLKNKKILLIDKEKKDKKDKTFCFWSRKDEPIFLYLQDLITKSWDTLELHHQRKLSLLPLSYSHIDSIDLYRSIQEVAEKYNWDTITDIVTSISQDNEGIFIEICDRQIRGTIVFDSRTPSYESAQDEKPYISQSFVGWMIETQSESIDAEIFRFMDFDIDQQNSTQFIYVLPFSSTRALVEVTRFGDEAIETREAEKILEKYIQKSYGEFKKVDIENGCIPMTHRKIENESMPGLIQLGARNYNIKASTGYAFKNMYYEAFSIAKTLKKDGNIDLYNREHTTMFHSRFVWYDSLLLAVLKNNPEYGKSIFIGLLQNIDMQKILKFLDEKTSITEEISIFLRLPWKPFLIALYRQVSHYPIFQPVLLTLFTLFFITLGDHTLLQAQIGFILFFLGMITIGIPHGAIDHLLEGDISHSRKILLFISRYVFLASMMGITWFLVPQIALIIFIIYSMWHFGQADGVRWHFSSVTSLIWGGSVIFYILGTHIDEANMILVSLGSLPLPFSLPVWSSFPWLLWGIYKRQASFLVTLFWITLSSQIPLLFAFGIYYIGQHSLTGWKHLKIHLRMSDKNIWLQSLPFHGGAWCIGILFFLFWPSGDLSDSYGKWGLFFIVISCISFPHVIAMHSLYHRIAKNIG